MWTDENGTVHTIWVPPEAILGEEALASLRDVPADLRAAAVTELDADFDRVFDEAAAAAAAIHGPVEVDDPDELDHPPLITGLQPRPGESLATTVRDYLAGVPARWRVEALEAVVDVLEDETPAAPEESPGE